MQETQQRSVSNMTSTLYEKTYATVAREGRKRANTLMLTAAQAKRTASAKAKSKQISQEFSFNITLRSEVEVMLHPDCGLFTGELEAKYPR